MSVGDPSINIMNTFKWRCTSTSTYSAAAFLIVWTVNVIDTQLSTESYSIESPRTHSRLFCYTNTEKPDHWMTHCNGEKYDQCIRITYLYRSIHWCPHPLLQHFSSFGQSPSWEHISAHILLREFCLDTLLVFLLNKPHHKTNHCIWKHPHIAILIPLYGAVHWRPHPLLQHFSSFGQSLSWEHISAHTPIIRVLLGHTPGFSTIKKKYDKFQLNLTALEEKNKNLINGPTHLGDILKSDVLEMVLWGKFRCLAFKL